MFRGLRRKEKAISMEETKAILKNGKRAALAVNGDDGYPYTMPINYYYSEEDNRIYFHCSKKGHKIESICKNDKVCMTVWDDGYLVEGDWAYFVSSCVVFGRASIIQDPETATEKIRQFALKYYPTAEEVDEEIEKDGKAVNMMQIEIEHISGKKIQEK